MQESTSSESNLLVLTLYIIGVSYVFNLMVESIEQKIKYTYDAASVNQQLKDKELADKVSIAFKIKPSYDIEGKDDLKEFLLILTNQSDNLAVYVDWDNCSFSVKHKGQSRRVIRKSPNLSRDLAVQQTPSLAFPTQKLIETVTTEDVFGRDQETGTYDTTKPLVNIMGLKDSPLRAQRKLYKHFISRRQKIEFSLQLALRFSEIPVGLVPGKNVPPMYTINCPFTINKLPWTYALPWNKKRKQ